MALYLVKAKPRKDLMANLRQELDSGNISKLRPFGKELYHGLDTARIENDYAYWIEEDYCRHLRWNEPACWTAISTTLQSSQ